MSEPKKGPRTGGRKSKKRRAHITLTETMNYAAEVLGAKTFGNKTAYLEHLILNDLRAQGLTIVDIEKMAEEHEKKKAGGNHE